MPDSFSGLNFELYNSRQGVDLYLKDDDLQPAERMVLDELRDELPHMDVLDAGVGTGRTTPFLAPHAQSYRALDYAPRMVEAARARFPALDIRVADAAALDFIDAESIDLVLFSYNGLDCLSGERREQALREFWRILRPAGHLIFSSHNLNFLPDLTRGFRSGLSLNPTRLLRSLKRFLRFLVRNHHPTYSADLTSALVFERQLGFEFPLLFVRPDFQLAELRRLGWRAARALACDSASILDTPEALRDADCPWVYYSCRKPSVSALTSRVSA